jgi:hypothetical protein
MLPESLPIPPRVSRGISTQEKKELFGKTVPWTKNLYGKSRKRFDGPRISFPAMKQK